jgi:hypothetical protein
MKKPSHKELVDFLGRWRHAQARNDVEGMELLLAVEWLNQWWWLFMEANDRQSKADHLSCLERTLIKAGLIGDRPTRPSELAMATVDFKQRVPDDYRPTPEEEEANGPVKFTLDEFITCVHEGLFVDDDGVGHYSDGTTESTQTIRPSEIEDDDDAVDRSFTHIIWYNK